MCLGEEVRRYVSGAPGPPGPAGAPGRGSNRFSMQEVAERVLSIMNGGCDRGASRLNDVLTKHACVHCASCLSPERGMVGSPGQPGPPGPPGLPGDLLSSK